MLPSVTVVVPVFNHERFIAECVESVLAQDYPGLEIVVVDDGSTDRTPQILAGFGGRIRVIRQENSGAATALNVGIKVATGEWIGWLSSDDVYLPGKISAQMTTAVAHPGAALIYTDWIRMDAAGRELSRHEAAETSPDFGLWQLLQRNHINGSSVFVRRKIFERYGYFDVTLRADVDGDMWLRLLRAGETFVRCPGFYLRYRWHSGNMSHQRLLMRQCADATRSAVMREASAAQLFPADVPGGSRGAAKVLISALIGRECYGAAALAIGRAGSVNRPFRGAAVLAVFLRMLQAPSSEPLVACGRWLGRLRRFIVGG